MANLTDYLKSNNLVLVDFSATWCGPCKMMIPILSELKTKIDASTKIIKIDVDKNQSAANHYQVRGVPTLILFKKGQSVWRQSGVVQADQLLQIINSHK